MKKLAYFALASFGALALAGCGSSDDASTDAMADDVEVPADEAMAAAGDASPVADPSASEDALGAPQYESGQACPQRSRFSP